MTSHRFPPKRTNHERWLVSYADLITLLFAFFVVLYASSEVDKVRMARLGAAIEGAFQQLGAVQPVSDRPRAPSDNKQPPSTNVDAHASADPSDLELTQDHGMTAQESEAISRELQDVLAREIQRGEVAVRTAPEGLVVSLREVGFFESGSATVKASAEPTVARVARALRSHAVSVRIEGHTDDVPIHTSRFASNWELSTARATGLVKSLITEYEFSPNRLSAAGLGEFHPIAANSSEDGRRQNRRVDLVILR